MVGEEGDEMDELEKKVDEGRVGAENQECRSGHTHTQKPTYKQTNKRTNSLRMDFFRCVFASL